MEHQRGRYPETHTNRDRAKGASPKKSQRLFAFSSRILTKVKKQVAFYKRQKFATVKQMVSPLFCVFCVFAQGFSLKMQLVLQKNQKKPTIIMVWHFKMLQTLVFHPFGNEHAIKPMVFHILNPMKIPGGPMGSWMLESNQRIEPKNRINESNQ